jgi:hypothetical protein
VEPDPAPGGLETCGSGSGSTTLKNIFQVMKCALSISKRRHFIHICEDCDYTSAYPRLGINQCSGSSFKFRPLKTHFLRLFLNFFWLFYIVSCFTRKKFIKFIKFIVKNLNEGNQNIDADKRIRIRIHNTGYTVFVGRCCYTSQNSVTLRRRQ